MVYAYRYHDVHVFWASTVAISVPLEVVSTIPIVLVLHCKHYHIAAFVMTFVEEGAHALKVVRVR